MIGHNLCRQMVAYVTQLSDAMMKQHSMQMIAADLVGSTSLKRQFHFQKEKVLHKWQPTLLQQIMGGYNLLMGKKKHENC